MILRIGLSLGLFIGSLAAGWWLGRGGLLTEDRASRAVRLVVTRLSPVVLGVLFWRMDFSRIEPWLLPLLGTGVSATTLLPAFWYARRARLSRPATGSFLTCAFFSNLGYFGAFTAFALFGEEAYGLCVLYFLFFSPCFYTLGFGLARRYGGPHETSGLRAAYQEGLQLYPFLGMLAGFALSLAGVPRPDWLEWVTRILIPVDTALYLVAIGSQLTFLSPRPWLRECLAMSAIKFVYTPLVAWGLLTLFGIQGLTRMVVLLEASTPVAVSPLVLPLLFGLDRRLANSLWLFTTLCAVLWFLVLLPLLPRL